MPIKLLCLEGREVSDWRGGKEGSPSARCMIAALLCERDHHADLVNQQQQQRAPKNYMRRWQNLLRQRRMRWIECGGFRAVERLMRLLPLPATQLVVSNCPPDCFISASSLQPFRRFETHATLLVLSSNVPHISINGNASGGHDVSTVTSALSISLCLQLGTSCIKQLNAARGSSSMTRLDV